MCVCVSAHARTYFLWCRRGFWMWQTSELASGPSLSLLAAGCSSTADACQLIRRCSWERVSLRQSAAPQISASNLFHLWKGVENEIDWKMKNMRLVPLTTQDNWKSVVLKCISEAPQSSWQNCSSHNQRKWPRLLDHTWISPAVHTEMYDGNRKKPSTRLGQRSPRRLWEQALKFMVAGQGKEFFFFFQKSC